MKCFKAEEGLSVVGGLKIGVARTGITSKEYDLGLIYMDRGCVWSAVVTQNKVKAAPVVYDTNLLKKGKPLRAVVVNSGNANACNRNGFEAVDSVVGALSEKLGIDKDEVFVASTGIIGEDMPYQRIVSSLDEVINSLREDAHREFARAIMTTDSFPKEAACRCSFKGLKFSIGAAAKGAGMIHPNMATMLAFIGTDININRCMLRDALVYAVDRSFNRISVDGDTSTNDTVLIFSTCEADNEEIKGEDELFRFFVEKLTEVCTTLAKSIVKDGEGATRVAEVIVVGADTEYDARDVATSVATSSLVKTAIFGGDPNWGRIVAACGYSKARVSLDRLSVSIGDFEMFVRGKPVRFDRVRASEYMKNAEEIKILVDLASGTCSHNMWFSDLTYDYIKINAEYHT